MSNIHATGLVAADRGLLITGPSGSGKSLLALSIIARCRAAGIFARLVSDDQLFMRVAGRHLIATAPGCIAGLAEIRGVGPVSFPHERTAVIDLVARLVPAERVERLDPGETDEMLGTRVCRIDVPERNVEAAGTAVLARLLALPDRAIGS